jgi:hypothetical protein
VLDEEDEMAKEFTGKIEFDIRDSTPDWDAFLADKAPEGAPNVLVILYDDTGLAAWSPYGGRIEMPTMQSSPTTGSRTASGTRLRSARRRGPRS